MSGTGAALCGLALLALAPPVAGDAPVAGERGRPFWLALARDCAVPGESAFGLVGEALSFLGSPDSGWRDDVGYHTGPGSGSREGARDAPADPALTDPLATAPSFTR
jgi:hypothetical protein